MDLPGILRLILSASGQYCQYHCKYGSALRSIETCEIIVIIDQQSGLINHSWRFAINTTYRGKGDELA